MSCLYNIELYRGDIMRQRIIAFVLTFMFIMVGSYINDVSVNAESVTEAVDISAIWTKDALIGYMDSQTWGIYLLEGNSIINDAGTNKIGAGGITTAARMCNVSVNVIVEQKVSGSWLRVTSWSGSRTNALSVTSSKYVYIDNGYYYRVRSVHRASTDGGSSCTSSLWM